MASKRPSTDEGTNATPPFKVIRSDSAANDELEVEDTPDNSSATAIDRAENQLIHEASKHVEALGTTISTLSKRLHEERVISAGSLSKLREENEIVQTRIAEVNAALLSSENDRRAKVSELKERLGTVEKSYSVAMDKANKRKEQAQVLGSKESLEEMLEKAEAEHGLKVKELQIIYDEGIRAQKNASTKIISEAKADCRLKVEKVQKAMDTRIDNVEKKHQKALDAKVKAYNKTIEDLKRKQKERQEAQAKWSNKKLADLQEKNDKQMQVKIKDWGSKINALKEKHKDQVAKMKAGSKMVEAAKKFVEISGEKNDGPVN